MRNTEVVMIRGGITLREEVGDDLLVAEDEGGKCECCPAYT
jgi:hypothetical protein